MRTFITEADALAFINTLPWGIAAGVCRDRKRAINFASTGVNFVGYGSIIEEKGWGGNPGDNFWFDEGTGNGINAIGLGDPGIDQHLESLAGTRTEVNVRGAELWVSYSARQEYDPQMYHRAAKRIDEHDAADTIEGNYSCGNIVGTDGKRKPVACFDIPRFDEGVAALKEGAGKRKTAAKLAPNTERRSFEDQLAVCVKHQIDYVILSNTIGNCYMRKPDGSNAIDMVAGGASGSILIPIVSGMLIMAEPILKGTRTKAIATGGVSCGQVAYNYLLLKAAGFAFNTHVTRPGHGPHNVQDIILGVEGKPGLAELLMKHGLPD